MQIAATQTCGNNVYEAIEHKVGRLLFAQGSSSRRGGTKVPLKQDDGFAKICTKAWPAIIIFHNNNYGHNNSSDPYYSAG